ncbi:nuclear transport factor 2 family protein [Caulobacter sp. KR2-114]|uniref:nuclear transport factor 2 family protein n=1 Tax=Caulobacter sp. KR2-114 TaxID=3400912 RepID=UPI003C0E6A4A
MPDRAVVEAFAAAVEAGRFIEALEGWYAPQATMRENVGAPRGGLPVLIEGERHVMARSKAIKASRLSPILIEGDMVAIRWAFEFTGADDKVRRMEEIAWQRWDGDKVVEEQFFYDPGQMA